jgi:hypothetical protein
LLDTATTSLTTDHLHHVTLASRSDASEEADHGTSATLASSARCTSTRPSRFASAGENINALASELITTQVIAHRPEAKYRRTSTRWVLATTHDDSER